MSAQELYKEHRRRRRANIKKYGAAAGSHYRMPPAIGVKDDYSSDDGSEVAGIPA